MESREHQHLFTEHSRWAITVAFSPETKLLAPGSMDETVTFSPDGRIIASGSADMSVRLWMASSGDQLYVLQGHTSGVNFVAFTPDGLLLASGSLDDELGFWHGRNYHL